MKSLALAGALLLAAEGPRVDPAPQPAPQVAAPIEAAAPVEAPPVEAPRMEPAPAPAPPTVVVDGRWSELDGAQREALLATIRTKALSERVLQVSARFLNTPYAENPLGEGEGIDPDPKLRFDGVDCLTFVEETLALALAPSGGDIEPLLERVRYDGAVSYVDRNHLMEAQWLPHNLKLGLLRDVTREYGGDVVVGSSKLLTPASWQSPSSQALQLPPERRPLGTFPLAYIPLAQAERRLRGVPAGTLVVVVREDRPFKATRMTHLGFLVEGARISMRHASKSRHKRVVDEPLAEFVARHARYDKWRVVGVSLFAIQEPRSPVATSP